MLLSVSLGQTLPSSTRVNGRNKTCESFSFEKQKLIFVITWVINVRAFFLLPQTLFQRHLFCKWRATKGFSADKLRSQGSGARHAISFTQPDFRSSALAQFLPSRNRINPISTQLTRVDPTQRRSVQNSEDRYGSWQVKMSLFSLA